MRRSFVVLALAVLAIGLVEAVLAGPLRGQARAFSRFLVRSPGRVLQLPSPIEIHADQGLPVPMILGYYYNPGGGDIGLARYAGILNGLVPFWYTIQADGSVTGAADPSVLNFAARHRMWLFALVQNMSGPLVYHRLLNDPLARQRALENLLGLCETYGYDGVNLDFEGIAPGDRRAFTNFVAALTRLLHANGYYVTLSVPAETADEPTNDWTGAYDYRALGRVADLLMIMAYDEHSSDSTAGPIAGPSWVERVLRYATSVVPPQKLVLGLPAYGYDWSPDGTLAISWQEWRALVAHYAPAAGASGHLEYWSGGVLHNVYYEDMKSFEASIRLAVGFDLRGIVLWRLGIENPSIWPYVGS